MPHAGSTRELLKVSKPTARVSDALYQFLFLFF